MVGSRRPWTIAAICFLSLAVLAGGLFAYFTKEPLEPMASVAPSLRMNELAIRLDPILPSKPDIEVMRRSESSDAVDPKMFEIDGPRSSSQATIEQRSRVEFDMGPPMARMAPPPVAQPAPRPPARPAEREEIAAAARPAELDEAAVEAEVARRAKPAVVKFEIETKMAMGQVYEAKLEILRPGGGRESLITGAPELNERVQILNKARATISSAHMKIERLLPEWQEIPTGGRGFWTWKVEPQKPGKAQLLVLVEHAGTFDKQERIFNVEQFPKTIEIEVGFWQSVQEAIAGFSPSITAIAAIAGALGGIAASVAAGLAWLRNRRKEPGEGDDDSHGLPAT